MDRPLPIIFENPNRQQGAALFMALIVLLVLTILGVFGMNIARLENLMAGNSQFQARALNNAEATLAAGEKVAQTAIEKCTVPGVGYYDLPSGSKPAFDPAAVNWPDASYQTLPTTTPPDSAVPSRFIVEYFGPYKDKKCSQSYKGSASYNSTTSISDCVRYIFLVTAQNDSSRGARRTVQSVYVSAKPPC
jgi:Tfp pilus assembly protein PilX